MKIAFISAILHYPWGGADTLWTHAAEAASRRGDQLLLSVSTAVTGHPRIAALIGAGAEVVVRNPPVVPASLAARVLRKLGLARSADARLIAALGKFRPDVVVFSQGGTYDLILHRELTAWLREAGISYRLIANWQEEHPLLEPADLTFIREAFAGADSINFVSTRNLTVTRRHLGADLPNARVIQNPLRWQAADVTPWPAGPVARLATVSRLDESKGIRLLLQALAHADPTLPDWRLNIFGLGPDEARLREESTRLKLGDRVRFRGYVRELRAVWSDNQLMVSPALEDGVPMTIPEAMLCQRPVLATCVGGAEDWIRAGTTGFLCPAPTVEALAATLRDACAAHAQWEDMGRHAATAAAAHYRPDDHLLLIS